MDGWMDGWMDGQSAGIVRPAAVWGAVTLVVVVLLLCSAPLWLAVLS